jgi:hypothetical protein
LKQGLNIEATTARRKRRDNRAKRGRCKIDCATAPTVGKLVRDDIAGNDSEYPEAGGEAKNLVL